MPPSRQIPLQFPETSLSFDDMAITGANRAICGAIRNVERWPYHAFCLFGPAGSGVSTLARAWARERNADYVTGHDLSKASDKDLEAFSQTDTVIDDVDQLGRADRLLILLSAIKRNGNRVLLASHSAPASWQFQSPDLKSRLHAAPLAEIPAPDEELMRARLKRAFSRSALKLPETVEDYLVTRLGLDYSLIEHSVEILAGASGERPLTIPLAREILEEENT